MRFILAAILFLLAGPVFAAPPYLLLPCATNTPAPSECRCKLGADPQVVLTPHTDATGKKYCYCELGGKSGTLAYSVTPANAWGPGPVSSGSLNMADFAAPAALGTATVVPALP